MPEQDWFIPTVVDRLLAAPEDPDAACCSNCHHVETMKGLRSWRCTQHGTLTAPASSCADFALSADA